MNGIKKITTYPKKHKRNDGRTWMRKHELIHEIQNCLDLSDRATANLLGVPEKDLEELNERLQEKITP